MPVAFPINVNNKELGCVRLSIVLYIYICYNSAGLILSNVLNLTQRAALHGTALPWITLDFVVAEL
jgi:hypothetical protein